MPSGPENLPGPRTEWRGRALTEFTELTEFVGNWVGMTRRVIRADAPACLPPQWGKQADRPNHWEFLTQLILWIQRVRGQNR